VRQDSFDELLSVLEQGASVTALRGLLFFAALAGGFAWFRRAPRLAAVLMTLGAVLALFFWLLQIRSPFGFGTDQELTRQWAQAGVNAAAPNQTGGFVLGTPETRSLIGALARTGLPRDIVFSVPQASGFLFLALAAVLPMLLIRGREAAAFTTCVAVSGGLWPGTSCYQWFLLRPSRIMPWLMVGAIAVVLARRRGFRRRFKRSRVAVAMSLLGVVVVSRAIGGMSEAEALSPILLFGASIILAPSLRALLRRASPSSARFRAAEAVVLVAVFTGSGLFWWEPSTTLKGFAESRGGNGAVSRPMQWISRNVPAGDVVVTNPGYSTVVAAFGGRRVLFPAPDDTGHTDALTQPFRRARLLESTLEGRPSMRLAEEFGATHLFLGPGDKAPPDPETPAPLTQPTLRLVPAYQDAEDFRIFRLTKK
jgi:hypothetical protein